MTRLKLVAIVGPTASGKSAWGVKLAKQFNGVIISADSRQIYKGCNIATAKITPAEMMGVPHYMLSAVRPNISFNVASYQKTVYRLLDKLRWRNRLTRRTIVPFLVGGTGLYISAITDGYRLPNIPPNPKLRAQLELKSSEELVNQLHQLDPDSTTDKQNKRRVIRALEILLGGGSRPPKSQPDFEVLKIGIKLSRERIYKNIEQRIRQLDWNALVKETKKLIRARLDFSSNPLTAIYYRPVRDFIEGKTTQDQTITKLIQGDKNYAKRQLTWFKKDSQIHWVTTLNQAERLVRKFLNESN
ncbi:tRNA (adenosine(37)-N6)-dimethylallyltransferase MiaA [candidate division Kazan bacterium RIFCSPHIGHO2_01_FULL_44_14]|uniref:tRNA dimethylallyltransferase n=1 Tax=candidate division Kazan bacterium RIFCSPLOWO2_01_FULL_45_19 TaxID=1798538 RepID=A0A1F4NPQ6_UNCK3|nr:hypothetical protein [uncultured bacterium]OGB73443.1 MAG: tRNA (adenosine(37)-N6)-dimethylallyltransferase MiaA [candidate division Kazan bacterium RIFCSPLOWO2_01_FULL_45_19]OGB77688.1 MAG: tRNA (adenosine(37)-N6)-dimethylallyltransferase MiaA [candidate division Kazan bacterium RIFCSPHIGHO2_01_FULL_44_14]